MRRTPKLVLGLAAIAGLALSGCQKPPPTISVWTSGGSLQLAPLCWSSESDGQTTGGCDQETIRENLTSDSNVIEVAPGNTIGISVDQEVAAAGWIPVIDGNPLTNAPLQSTYFRFSFPVVAPETGAPLQVVTGQGSSPKGVWAIRLIPKTS